MGGKVPKPLAGNGDWTDKNLSGGLKADKIQPPIAGQDLILTAHGLPEHLLLQMNRVPGQLHTADHIARQRVGCIDQAHSKAGARTHAATGRQVAVVMNLDAAIREKLLADCPDRRMPYFGGRIAGLGFGVNDPIPVGKEGRKIPKGNVAVLVDPAGEDGSAVFSEPAGVVRAPAEKGDAEGGAGDDHVFDFSGLSPFGHPRNR